MILTDSQKDCITKAKEYLHIIPKVDGAYRWKDLPGKVLAITEMLTKSKLSQLDFANELKISQKALAYFVKGKGPLGEPWPELQKLKNPKASANLISEKTEKFTEDKTEKILSDRIIELLSLPHYIDSGLRDSTLRSQLKSDNLIIVSIPVSSFITKVLNNLQKENRIEKKAGWWKLKTTKEQSVIPDIICANPTETKVISMPVFETQPDYVRPLHLGVTINKEKELENAWKLVRQNLDLVNVNKIEGGFVYYKLPLKDCNLDYPLDKWRKVAAIAAEFFPKLVPSLQDLAFDILDSWNNDVIFLKALDQDCKERNIKTKEKLIEYFEKLIEVAGIQAV